MISVKRLIRWPKLTNLAISFPIRAEAVRNDITRMQAHHRQATAVLGPREVMTTEFPFLEVFRLFSEAEAPIDAEWEPKWVPHRRKPVETNHSSPGQLQGTNR